MDDGLEISCPNGGNGELALSSAEGDMVKDGRFRTVGAGGSRSVWSMGDARKTIGGSIEAVVAVELGEGYSELHEVLKRRNDRSERLLDIIIEI